jgi:hypothetical protein
MHGHLLTHYNPQAYFAGRVGTVLLDSAEIADNIVLCSVPKNLINV